MAASLADVDPEILANPCGVLATNGLDGTPQMTVVWFVADGETIRISINAKRHKARTLANDPQCSFLLTHPETANYYTEIRGTATVSVDTDYAFADILGPKYGADMRNFDQPGDTRLVIEITPTKIITVDVRH